MVVARTLLSVIFGFLPTEVAQAGVPVAQEGLA